MNFFLYIISTSVYSALFNVLFFICTISAIFKSLLCNCMYVCLHVATLSHGIGTFIYVCVHFLLYWKLLSPSQIPHWKKLKQLSNKKHGQMTGRYGCQTKPVKLPYNILNEIMCKNNTLKDYLIKGFTEKKHCYFTDVSLFQLWYFT